MSIINFIWITGMALSLSYAWVGVATAIGISEWHQIAGCFAAGGLSVKLFNLENK